MRRFSLRVFSIALLCFAVSTAWSQSTLHIGPGAGTKCAEGCAGDPNLIAGATKVDIYQTSAGAPTLSQPVLIIFGVPSEFGSRLPLMPIIGVKSINPYPGGTTTLGTEAFGAGVTYACVNPASSVFFDTMFSCQEVYSYV